MSQKSLERFLLPETRLLLDELHAHTGSRFRKLNAAMAQLIDDWSMISFTALDYSEEDSIAYVLSQVILFYQFIVQKHIVQQSPVPLKVI